MPDGEVCARTGKPQVGTAWPDDVLLSAYDGGGRPLAPERAYAGMPEDARLAAAVCDAAIRDDWPLVASVWLTLTGEPEPMVSTRTEHYFAEMGWRDIDDVYDAASVSKAQRVAFGLHLTGYTAREIGELMDTTALAAKLQVFRASEKLHRVVTPLPDVTAIG